MNTLLLRFPFPIAAVKAKKRVKATDGFTLIETVLALGVVSFSFVGILSMMLVGLTNFREAVNATSESQLVRSVSNDILLTSYSSLMAKGYPYSRYFDEEGNEVAVNAASRYFEAEISVDPVAAPGVDNTVATTFLILVKTPKLQAPKSYTLLVPKG
ncbi:MAG: Verru_Chthon cassette protein B [Candidatus Methylacidiphilales bacterium]|nr:Verru_Chthon cassette protein B [Candidatus Methylacidiphilales bacterium]